MNKKAFPDVLAGLGDTTTERLTEMFRLLGERNRLLLVYACLDQPHSVQALAERVDISVSLASHHLRLLRAARVVSARRSGKQIFYVAADGHVERVLRDMVSDSLARD